MGSLQNLLLKNKSNKKIAFPQKRNFQEISMKRLFILSVLLSFAVLANSTSHKGNSSMTRNKTNSGLEYEIIQQGTGVSPQKGQRVTVHYTGWLNDRGNLGKKFDSSVDRGKPFVFIIGAGQVIQGWDEGVISMKVGEKRRLYIPSQLGYSIYGAGMIPPNADLIFDVELLNVA